jgi:hypothetical protein
VRNTAQTAREILLTNDKVWRVECKEPRTARFTSTSESATGEDAGQFCRGHESGQRCATRSGLDAEESQVRCCDRRLPLGDRHACANRKQRIERTSSTQVSGAVSRSERPLPRARRLLSVCVFGRMNNTSRPFSERPALVDVTADMGGTFFSLSRMGPQHSEKRTLSSKRMAGRLNKLRSTLHIRLLTFPPAWKVKKRPAVNGVVSTPVPQVPADSGQGWRPARSLQPREQKP